jgi:hypothetical protein
MIHKISEAWKIPAELLVRPYKIKTAALPRGGKTAGGPLPNLLIA